jgi:NAD-dependent dihydropyrimidine dehydrogenase PreA subunit
MALMPMNLAIYLAFFFVSFFICFFVGIFGVVMLQLSGLVDLAAEGADQQIPAALAGMMSTPYGWALSIVYATGLGGLAFLALRLLLTGAATVKTGRVMVKDEDVCLHCGLCAERCPTSAWDMQKSILKLPQAGGICRT